MELDGLTILIQSAFYALLSFNDKITLKISSSEKLKLTSRDGGDARGGVGDVGEGVLLPKSSLSCISSFTKGEGVTGAGTGCCILIMGAD